MASESIPEVASVTHQVIGEFHLIFVFLPLFFFTAALTADLFYYFGKKRGFKVGHWMTILGWLSCMPTIVTGIYAAFDFDAANAVLAEHRLLAYTTGIASSLYAGLRISALFWNITLLPSHFVGFSVLMLALVCWTSDYGLLLSLDVTPITTLEELKNTPTI